MPSARTEAIAEDSIRADYLRNNDAYITNSLRRLAAIPGLVGSGSVEEYAKHRAAFKKCGAKIKAWMAVNTDWRCRCSKEAVERNTGWAAPKSFDIESCGTHMVFNNPAVAVELGLLEVLKVQIEVFQIHVVRDKWSGLLTNNPRIDCFSLTHLSLVADRKDLLECVMDASSFYFMEELHYNYGAGILADVLNSDVTTLESVDTFFWHPTADKPNFTIHPGGENPLLEVLNALRNDNNNTEEDQHAKICKRAIDVLRILLRCGADPNFDIEEMTEEEDKTPLDRARRILGECVVKPIEERGGWSIKYLAEYIDLME